MSKRKAYHVVIDPQSGNTDVSIANAMRELSEFRKLHPPPPPLPPKPTQRQKGKR